MTVKDNQGYLLSGATPEALPAYAQAIKAFHLVCGDAVGSFDAARGAAPEFVMAYLGKAWLLTMANDPGLLLQASALLDAARPLAKTEREQAHFAALNEVAKGNRAAAVAILDRHLLSHPFDLVAHQAAALCDGFLGRFPWVQGRSARALPRWPKDRPDYATMLAMHAFGAEEAGDYARAEAESREAAELEPLSFWPHHTVSHVMEMTGRPEDGLAWMTRREPLWSTPAHANQAHIWWHRALFHIELGQYQAALELYDGPVRATQRPIGNILTNASALLWRLDILGCELGSRWQELVDIWDGHADGKCLVFTDIHAAMAELGTGREAAVECRLEAMRETARSEREAAALYRSIGIPVVEGLMAFRRGDYGRTVDLLLQSRFELWRIGGSHAQRDVVDWTLVEAAIRGGQRETAVSLAHERLGRRPRSIPNGRFLRGAEAIAA